MAQELNIVGICKAFTESRKSATTGKWSPDAFNIQPIGTEDIVRLVAFRKPSGERNAALSGIDGESLVGLKIRAKGTLRDPQPGYEDQIQYTLVEIVADDPTQVKAKAKDETAWIPSGASDRRDNLGFDSKDGLIVAQVFLYCTARLLAGSYAGKPEDAVRDLKIAWEGIKEVDEPGESNTPASSATNDDDDIGVLSAE